MHDIAEFHHTGAEESATHLAARVADLLKRAIARSGRASLAVSGGSTPALMFDRLSAMRLEWDKVTLAQVDERWVDPASPESNQGLIRSHLLKAEAAAARFVPMYNGATTAAGGQIAYEAFLRAMPEPFDAVLLGMGEDGHTASLFPGAEQLDAGLHGAPLCLALTPPFAARQRLTLSLAGLRRSRLLILQINGAHKAAVYREALRAGSVEEMPVRAVLRQKKVQVEVWVGT